jgi:hypothetical protein
MFRNMYGHLSQVLRNRIDSMETANYKEYSSSDSLSVADRSSQYGKKISEAIYNWSTKDGGHEGYKYGFPNNYIPPVGLGLWVPPTGNAQSPGKIPLHPYWGRNRVFVAQDSNVSLSNKLLFDSLPDSEYHKLFKTVYDKNRSLTQSEKEIALWWGDDPTLSYSPPGHSMNIAKIIAQSENLDVFKTAELMALTGISLADAFTVCWKIKYQFNSERPSSFINKYIDRTWLSFWPEPLFPAFPSGHSTQIGAVAHLFKTYLKKDIYIYDNTNVGIPDDLERKVSYIARNFATFEEMAQECANSRLYGGIHTNEDNSAGLEIGKMIGDNVYHTLTK